MTTAMQFDLFGGLQAPQDLDPYQKVAYILENHPETRNDDRLLLLWHWWEWDGLYNLLSVDQFEDLLAWAIKGDVTKPETIRRRRQEIHQLRTGAGSLLPSPQVAAARRERDGAGPPRRRR